MGVCIRKWVLSTVNNCLFARLEHFAKFQKRKPKFSEDQKKHLKHAVGRKTKREKEGGEKERKELDNSGSVSGNDDADESKDKDKTNDESPQKTKDKGKGKATANHAEKGEIQDKALRERIDRLLERKREEDEIWKSTSRWRWEVLTGKVRNAEKIGEEKWKAAMEAGTDTSSRKAKVNEVGAASELPELRKEVEKPRNRVAQAGTARQAQETQLAPMDEKSRPRRDTSNSYRPQPSA